VSYGGSGGAAVVMALGGDVRVNGTPYNDTLDGGAGHDQLIGNAGADHLVGGVGTDWLKGGDGYDELSGGAGTDGLRGDAGNDRLAGGAGSDDMQGGGGDDILDGGGGRDRLIGGSGRDVFAFNALGEANFDAIADFSVPDDVFRLDSSVFVGLVVGPMNIGDFALGRHAGEFSTVLYDPATGDLLFDADAAGAGAAVRFATVTQDMALTAADFIVV
jgi:Ca2+-binding RTX toxin-like protein